MHSKSFLTNTYQVVIEYYDILENLYTQTITIVAIKEDNLFKKVHINSISKQEFSIKE